MTPEKASEIIAEYMFPDKTDRESRRHYLGELHYHTSIDDIMIVWDKLQSHIEKIECNDNYLEFTIGIIEPKDNYICCIESTWGYIDVQDDGEIASHAAAKATAQVIEVINESYTK